MDAASFELTLLECPPCLTLLECPPCLTAISGAQSGGLFHWIVGDHPDLRRWLQTSAHCLEQGEVFAPPQCRNLEQIHAVCDATEVPVGTTTWCQ